MSKSNQVKMNSIKILDALDRTHDNFRCLKSYSRQLITNIKVFTYEHGLVLVRFGSLNG